MRILIINSGSSSIKFQVIQMPSEQVLCKGLVERIGLENGHITYKKDALTIEKTVDIKDHKTGLQLVMDHLNDPEQGVLSGDSVIDAVGHRVVHGGDSFREATQINDEVLKVVKDLSFLAPLHNPANATGIEVCQELFPAAKQFAIFDTAFHQSIPAKAHTYAIPEKLAEEHKIKVYGFHGTSHKYVSEKAQEYLGGGSSKLISVHLGNGCSITAVHNGKSVEHSLGFGPSNGLVMGTRSGDVDQSVVFFLIESCGFSPSEVNTLLQKESGLLGLTGYSDLREVEAKAAEGDKKCLLALAITAHRIKKYIGAYFATLNGADAIVFTAGIGENSILMRKLACSQLEALGITFDEEKNTSVSSKNAVSEFQGNGPVKLLVIPTNEELEIAKQCYAKLS